MNDKAIKLSELLQTLSGWLIIADAGERKDGTSLACVLEYATHQDRMLDRGAVRYHPVVDDREKKTYGYFNPSKAV